MVRLLLDGVVLMILTYVLWSFSPVLVAVWKMRWR